MRNFLLFLIFSFTAVIAVGQTPAIVQDTIPFRNDLGIIILPISFNGVEKEFAFDTGAMRSVAFSWASEELKGTSKRIPVRSSNGSRTKMRLYKSGVIHLGSREIKKHKILKVGDSEIFTCHKIDGILGVDIMQHFNWKINYDDQYVVMYDKTYFPEDVSPMKALDFEFTNSRPYVYGGINGKKIKFLLDTGASDSDLTKGAFKESDLGRIPNRKFNSGFYDVKGTLTPTSSTLIRLPFLESDEVKFSPVLEYGKSKSKIGNTLWKGNTLFMSLSTQKLLVSDGAIQEAVVDYDCGLAFQKGQLIVIEIHENSEAWNAGVRQGDEVLSLNGKVFTDFCEFSNYYRKVASEELQHSIELKNGEKLIVKKQDLLPSRSDD